MWYRNWCKLCLTIEPHTLVTLKKYSLADEKWDFFFISILHFVWLKSCCSNYYFSRRTFCREIFFSIEIRYLKTSNSSSLSMNFIARVELIRINKNICRAWEGGRGLRFKSFHLISIQIWLIQRSVLSSRGLFKFPLLMLI